MTIRELLNDGFKLARVYSGKLNTCACGCGGNYYEEGRGFSNGKKKLEEFIDNEILDNKDFYCSNKHAFASHLSKNGKMNIYVIDGNEEVNIQITTREDEGYYYGYRLYLQREKIEKGIR